MVKEAVEWFGIRLLGKRLARNITVHVIGHDMMENYNGLCDVVDFDNNRYREFSIELSMELTDKQLLTVIAHEMVHVKQWARNEMRELKFQNMRWKGEFVDIKKVKYRNYPWEKEAYRLEKILYKEYKNRG